MEQSGAGSLQGRQGIASDIFSFSTRLKPCVARLVTHVIQHVHSAALPLPLPSQLRLHMPALLKKVVLDDHDLVTHQVKLQPLPRRPCVRDILRTFERSKAGEGGAAADAATLEVRLRVLWVVVLLFHRGGGNDRGNRQKGRCCAFICLTGMLRGSWEG